jgi:hypothetical protein
MEQEYLRFAAADVRHATVTFRFPQPAVGESKTQHVTTHIRTEPCARHQAVLESNVGFLREPLIEWFRDTSNYRYVPFSPLEDCGPRLSRVA